MKKEDTIIIFILNYVTFTYNDFSNYSLLMPPNTAIIYIFTDNMTD